MSKKQLSEKLQIIIKANSLRLAIPNYKIDIEVDGQAWHLDINGCRKADDIHRDKLMEALGWKVIRFWHHQIEGDIQACVSQVKQCLTSRKTEIPCDAFVKEKEA